MALSVGGDLRYSGLGRDHPGFSSGLSMCREGTELKLSMHGFILSLHS